jgi:large subunit ribosomal protein L13
MDMNRAFFLRKENFKPKWQVIDAEGKVLGRLATEVADSLRGKNKVNYTPHTDGGDYVVIINAEKIKLTGKKLDQKEYKSHSGWMSGLRVRTASELLVKHPAKVIELAVKRMLPKNKISREMFKKLKVYAGDKHPHKAQVTEKAA